jgi:uncharacterized protein involved in exopolysaccharide biosynthesis
MTLISMEEARTRIEDCNVLLKVQSFLQKNGLSDCGKGQIMGQGSLLQEYLKEQQQRRKQSSIDKSYQQQKEQDKKQVITTSDIDKVEKK